METEYACRQPVSRRRIAVPDVVHDVGLLQHAAVDLPALGGELPVVSFDRCASGAHVAFDMAWAIAVACFSPSICPC